MKKKIYFLTAGDVPSLNGLISSQVIKPAENLMSQGIEVEYIGVISILGWIKRTLVNKSGPLNHFRANTTLVVHYFFSFIHLGWNASFIFRNFLVDRAAKSLVKSVKLDRSGLNIFFCRSYFATDIALRIKKILENEGFGIRIIFDMRSILSIEIPYNFPKKGGKLFGYAKNWERELIQKSDVALLTTQRGIDLLNLENGHMPNLQYVPISGLKEVKGINYSFDEKWRNRVITYVGSVGGWHPLDSLLSVLNHFANRNFNPEIVTNNPSLRKTGIKSYSVPHSEINKVYDQMLALVVSGNNKDKNFYEAYLESVNLFSTKAAEALSAGVPIIVNEELRELSCFVKEHQCGVIFRYDSNGSIQLVDCTETNLILESYWRKLCENALSAGKIFRAESVLSAQLKIINSL